MSDNCSDLMPAESFSMTKWRLAYAKENIYTFLVHGVDEAGCCTCGKPNCKSPGKHPIESGKDRGATIDPQVIRADGKRYPRGNLAMHPGLSRFVIADVDPRNGGDETVARLDRDGRVLNTAVVVDTGGGGVHYFFRMIESESLTSLRSSLGAGIDLLHGNKYPVLPPSKHHSGAVYTWRKDCDPWSAGWLISQTPSWMFGVVDKRDTERDREVDEELEDDLDELAPHNFDWLDQDEVSRLRSALQAIPADSRDTWFKVGAAIHHASDGSAEGEELWEEWSNGSEFFPGCPSLFDGEEQEATWQGLKRRSGRPRTAASLFYEAQQYGWADTSQPSEAETLGDISNGRRFAAQHRERFLFVQASRRWLHWSGDRWMPSDTGQHIQAAKRLADLILSETARDFADKPDEGNRKRHGLALTVHRSLPRLHALLSAASSEPGMSVPDQTAFDRDPMLLGTKNGVLDLKTGRLHNATPEHRISKAAGACFDPTAKCPRWQEFLFEVFGSEEVIAFVQRLVGYTLTGLVDEEVLVFMFGTGANGKSVFANVLMAVLGDYSVTVGTELLARNKAESETARYKLRLQGARLALANEVGQADTWDDQRIKEVTSRELIPARLLYAEAFSFSPTHTLWIRGNHQPTILDASDGMWRRLIQLPFTRMFAPEERIPDLDRQLIAEELSGILAWAVRGGRQWQQEGLAVPLCISQSTQRYRSESDVMGQWIEERCETLPEFNVAVSEAYADWTNFCRDVGVSPGAQPMFTRRMKARGTCFAKSNGRSLFRGLRIRRQTHNDTNEDDDL